MRILRIFLVAALATGLSPSALRAADDHAGHDHSGHDHAGNDHAGHNHGPVGPTGAERRQAFAKHQGLVLEKGDGLYEVVFSDRGVEVHPMSRQGEPRPVAGMSGTVVLRPTSSDGSRMRLALQPVPGFRGGPGLLRAEANLKLLVDGSRRAQVTIRGGAGGATVKLSTMFQRGASAAAIDHTGHNHGPGGHTY